MKEFLKFILIFLGLFFIFIGIIFSFVIGIGLIMDLSEPEKDSFEHKVTYTADLKSNNTLENVTVLLPYPDDKEFRRSVKLNASNVSIHNDWNATISQVNTTNGTMLKASIEKFVPETGRERFEREINESEIEGDTEIRRKIKSEEVNNSKFNDYVSYSLIIDLTYNNSIKTRRGLEIGPNIASHRSSTPGCGSFYEENCFNSSTQIFLSYDAENNTAVDLSLSLEGRNSWWNLGWSSNSFSQNFYTGFYDDSKVIGPQNDWIKLEGRERQSQGSYRR